MAKKYSVQMENDQIVSVEVDGVSYPNPDDIPDLQDRKKINAMIARTTGAGSDDGLDDQFAVEMSEMKSHSSPFAKLFLAIFFGVAAVLLGISAYSTVTTFQQISREVSVPGRVVDLVVRTSYDSESGDVTEFSYPVVEFAPTGGRRLKVQMSEGSSPPAYAVGDQVTVAYNPQQPGDARIKSFSSDLLQWLTAGITFIVGAVFAAVALVVLRLWPPYQKNTATPEGSTS